MAEALVERQPPPIRFFCHKCNVEFEDVVQDYLCPYCAGGFIEQLDNTESADESSEDSTSAAENSQNDEHPLFSDLALFMSGGRLRAGGAESLVQQLVWTLSAGLGGASGGGAGLVVGGDFVVGGEGLDAVVTQLLGQLESSGPPPMPPVQMQRLVAHPASPELAARNLTCAVCWDPIQLEESVIGLECEHEFHEACLRPWLQLHATCPVCRHNLVQQTPNAPSAPAPAPTPAPVPAHAPLQPQPPNTGGPPSSAYAMDLDFD